MKAEPSYEKTRQASQTRSRTSSAKTRALQALRDTERPLVIDDFHYLDREIQGAVVRALKALVFDGHPVVLVAIPHRRFDAVRVEREMTGRVHHIPIPVWTSAELSQIADLGPRPCTDRLQRRFKDGRTGDIYVAVLLAIASLKPGMATLEYEDVRAALRDLLEELPQAHEVSRVLDQMSSLQVSDSSSAPVLDWESKDRRLHITDPFFAFFLRWGAETLHGVGG